MWIYYICVCIILMLSMYLILTTVYCKSFKVKSFVVADIKCNLLENIRGWTVVMHDQGLLHMLATSLEKLVTDHLRKPQNFSASNNLQYTVVLLQDRIPQIRYIVGYIFCTLMCTGNRWGPVTFLGLEMDSLTVCSTSCMLLCSALAPSWSFWTRITFYIKSTMKFTREFWWDGYDFCDQACNNQPCEYKRVTDFFVFAITCELFILTK